MARDRSLDEFVGDDAENGDGGDAQTADDDAQTADSDADQEPSADVDEGPDNVDTEADDTERGAEPDDAERKPEPDDVEPATATYRWDPAGIECRGCGATVERVWSGDSGAVCADCKEW